MEIALAQEAFVRLLGQLKPDAKSTFLDWVHSEYGQPVEQGNEDMEEQESDLLENIAADLKEVLPPNAIAPGEHQKFPKTGPNSDLNPATTLHVDSFLYPTDGDVDQLCDRMGISRSYCLQCGSWKTAPLSFISHSASREQLKHIFCSLLPDLSGKTVLDIGSRLGSVLYGGYLYSRAASLLGIEMNPHLCELQQKVIVKYGLGERVCVLCSDIYSQSEVVGKADVIILINAFEFFLQPEEQARLWEFLYTTVRKKGTLLATMPSIQDCCLHLPFKFPLLLDGWVTEIFSGVDPNDEELSNIHLYCVV